MTGHLLGAAGGLEGGITALAIKHQLIPPTINYETPDPECDLDYVPNQKRAAKIDYALSNSFGFGGTNGALAVQEVRGVAGAPRRSSRRSRSFEDHEESPLNVVVVIVSSRAS